MTKKSLLVAALVAAISLGASSCKGWPDMQGDVHQLREITTVYIDRTQPKAVSETAKVDELGKRMQSILLHMEELTK